jgi:hypothetical protein
MDRRLAKKDGRKKQPKKKNYHCIALLKKKDIMMVPQNFLAFSFFYPTPPTPFSLTPTPMIFMIIIKYEVSGHINDLSFQVTFHLIMME